MSAPRLHPAALFVFVPLVSIVCHEIWHAEIPSILCQRSPHSTRQRADPKRRQRVYDWRVHLPNEGKDDDKPPSKPLMGFVSAMHTTPECVICMEYTGRTKGVPASALVERKAYLHPHRYGHLSRSVQLRLLPCAGHESSHQVQYGGGLTTRRERSLTNRLHHCCELARVVRTVRGEWSHQPQDGSGVVDPARTLAELVKCQVTYLRTTVGAADGRYHRTNSRQDTHEAQRTHPPLTVTTDRTDRI